MSYCFSYSSPWSLTRLIHVLAEIVYFPSPSAAESGAPGVEFVIIILNIRRGVVLAIRFVFFDAPGYGEGPGCRHFSPDYIFIPLVAMPVERILARWQQR
jgi:hypothetical protein